MFIDFVAFENLKESLGDLDKEKKLFLLVIQTAILRMLQMLMQEN